ncbi:MAG: sigma-70 family RNA polymerase sigma factor [Pseudonocardiaceae bacterium]|nr:sigma-70 family RNA polymerase sigma factor [Pseudonocardiaceae bacterium]
MSAPTTTAIRRGGEGQDEPDLVRCYLDDIGSTPLLDAAQEVALAKRIEAGVYAAELLRQASAEHRDVAAERRRELAAVARDGERAKDHMVRANLRLVVSVAKKHSHGGLPLLDVVQEGNLGLIHAVEKFDYAKGYKFSTYATWWIRQAIDRGLAVQTRTVRLPVHVVGELARFGRVERKLQTSLNREPTAVEVAEAAGTSAERITELRLAARSAISLDTPVGEDSEDTSVGDLIEDTDGPDVTEAVEQHALTDELRTLVDSLPDRLARIVSLRYGLHDGHQYTLQQVADRLSLTRERIRQLEKEALAALRDPQRHQRLLAWAA